MKLINKILNENQSMICITLLKKSNVKTNLRNNKLKLYINNMT